MLKNKALVRLTFLGAIIAWLVLLFSDITVLFSSIQGVQPDVPVWLPRVMLGAFIIFLFYYYKFRIELDDSLNFTDLLRVKLGLGVCWPLGGRLLFKCSSGRHL